MKIFQQFFIGKSIKYKEKMYIPNSLFEIYIEISYHEIFCLSFGLAKGNRKELICGFHVCVYSIALVDRNSVIASLGECYRLSASGYIPIQILL